MILCYLNNNRIEKYKELFDDFYKKDKNILFEVLLKYKLYLKKQIDLSKDILNEIIKFSTGKDFKIFKEDAIFYLKNINTFIEIIESNKNEIIKIKDFMPIEIPKIGNNEEIDFGLINPKIENIIKFSIEKKLLLIYLKEDFWDSLSKKCSRINRDNIELCYTLRVLLNKYFSMVKGLFEKDKDKKDKNSFYNKDNKIFKEIKNFYRKNVFTNQLDKIIKEYINTNDNITNMEIIELIKDYDLYYSLKDFKKKEILIY